MRKCYGCNRETDDLKRDPETGDLVCRKCREGAWERVKRVSVRHMDVGLLVALCVVFAAW